MQTNNRLYFLRPFGHAYFYAGHFSKHVSIKQYSQQIPIVKSDRVGHGEHVVVFDISSVLHRINVIVLVLQIPTRVVGRGTMSAAAVETNAAMDMNQNQRCDNNIKRSSYNAMPPRLMR